MSTHGPIVAFSVSVFNDPHQAVTDPKHFAVEASHTAPYALVVILSHHSRHHFMPVSFLLFNVKLPLWLLLSFLSNVIHINPLFRFTMEASGILDSSKDVLPHLERILGHLFLILRSIFVSLTLGQFISILMLWQSVDFPASPALLSLPEVCVIGPSRRKAYFPSNELIDPVSNMNLKIRIQMDWQPRC